MGADATNNIAEALACLIGILMALRLGAMSLGIGLDSMLLVHWLLGTSRCQDPILRRIVAQALLALGGIPSCQDPILRPHRIPPPQQALRLHGQLRHGPAGLLGHLPLP